MAAVEGVGTRQVDTPAAHTVLTRTLLENPGTSARLTKEKQATFPNMRLRHMKKVNITAR